MNGTTIDSFEASLDGLGVGVTQTTPDRLRSRLADLVTEPAVGVEVPIEGARLPEFVNTEPTPADLEAARTGVTFASLGVADYGTVVLESTPEGSEPASLFPDEHVAVLRAGDVVPDMDEAFEWLGDRLRSTRGSAILATGPSATADMGALVRGAHGPKDVHVVLVEEADRS